MKPIAAAWNGLDGGRRLAIGLSVLATLAAMLWIWRIAAQPDMALLYAGLDPSAAGEVVAALEQRGIPFEVRGGAIYVDSSGRDATRLALASEGMPAAGGAGYEILDAMTGFGTTAQMFDAAYWRAKEGELARTILAGRDVRAARVHVATPPRQAFSRDVQVTASVTLTPAGGAIDEATAEAARHLVASAIAGLKPEDVTVIDSVNGVIPLSGASAGASLAGSDQRAQQMKANLERLLGARVGAGKALVEVSIDADMDSQTITERVVDPASRVAISSEIQERSEESSGSDSGAVTVASNLPDGDTAGGAGASASSASETREIQNFEISETRRERIIRPGQIRKISVAVIVDGIVTYGADGTRTWATRSDEEMAALGELVQSAVGFDEARGDRISIQQLEFPAPPPDGTVAEAGSFAAGLDVGRIAQTAILGVVVLLLGLFVIRPLLTQKPAALPPPSGLQGDIIDVTGEETQPEAHAALQSADQNKIKNLRTVIEDRADDSADVLRRWIEAPDTSGGPA